MLKCCDSLVLPGGSNIEPELYIDGVAISEERDYRRSITELALLLHADKSKMPVLGICRGSQMVNVYFGGTLRQLPKTDVQWGWERLELLNSSMKEEISRWIGGSSLWVFSAHEQALDRIGGSLQLLMEHQGMPKLLISSNGQFIAVQFHPEAYLLKDSIGGPPEAIVNKGIYQFFFSKMLQYRAAKV